MEDKTCCAVSNGSAVPIFGLYGSTNRPAHVHSITTPPKSCDDSQKEAEQLLCVTRTEGRSIFLLSGWKLIEVLLSVSSQGLLTDAGVTLLPRSPHVQISAVLEQLLRIASCHFPVVSLSIFPMPQAQGFIPGMKKQKLLGKNMIVHI